MLTGRREEIMKKTFLLIAIGVVGFGMIARPARAWNEEHPTAKTEHHRDPFKHHGHHAKGHGTHPAVAHHHAHPASGPKPIKHQIARHESPKAHAKSEKAQAQ